MHMNPAFHHRCDRCLLCTCKRTLGDHLKSGKCEPYFSDVPHEKLLEQLESGARDNPWRAPHATRPDMEPELRIIFERAEHGRQQLANEEPRHGACITRPRALPPVEVVNACGRGIAPLADVAIAMFSDGLRYFKELEAPEVWLDAARAWVVVPVPAADALLDFVLDGVHDALCCELDELEGLSEGAARRIESQRHWFGMTAENPAYRARERLREILLERLQGHTARAYADQGGYPVERPVHFGTPAELARAAVAFNVLPYSGLLVLAGLAAAIEALCFATGEVLYCARLGEHHYVCSLDNCNFLGGVLPLSRARVVEKVKQVLAREVCGAIDAGHVRPAARDAFYAKVGAALGLDDVLREEREPPWTAREARKRRLARERAARLLPQIVHVLAKKHALVRRQCVNDRGILEAYERAGHPSA
jgi:hypothetical protein